ncbi:MAG TPA: phosphotransferase [Ktedonobacteraceae bacterium]|nr:phosphotransferase [Ktedonobacteraceae bacterium]
MRQLPLPGKLEEITPEWLTAIFRENALLTSQAVVAIQTDIIGQDRGFTGVIACVQLQYSDHEEFAPPSVVVKIPTATCGTSSAYRLAHQQDVTAIRRHFERCAREIVFYQQVAPMKHVHVPRLYYGAADSVTGRMILVLEDVHLARIGDALRGCSLQEATLVIDQLAHFHSQWWNCSPLDVPSWLPMWGGNPQEAQERYQQCINPFLQRFGERVLQKVRRMIDALATSYGAVRSRLCQAPVTMIHGDLHLDNILFNMGEHESGVTIIDWQSVARGRGAIDLALFLFDSLAIPKRRAVEYDLLRRYHERLVAGGITGYSFAQLMEDCQFVLLWLLGAKVVWLGSVDIDRLEGRERALVDASSMDFAALLDYNAGSLLPL